MSKIIVNDEHVIDGEFAIESTYYIKDNVIYKNISGVLSCKAPYIEYNIIKLMSKNIVVEGVELYKESYSTAEDVIDYYFKAKYYAATYNVDASEKPSIFSIVEYEEEKIDDDEEEITGDNDDEVAITTGGDHNWITKMKNYCLQLLKKIT